MSFFCFVWRGDALAILAWPGGGGSCMGMEPYPTTTKKPWPSLLIVVLFLYTVQKFHCAQWVRFKKNLTWHLRVFRSADSLRHFQLGSSIQYYLQVRTRTVYREDCFYLWKACVKDLTGEENTRLGRLIPSFCLNPHDGLTVFPNLTPQLIT